MTATATLNLDTAPVLLRAADIIAAHGHAKNDFVTGGGYCPAGAIGEACGIAPDDWTDYTQYIHFGGDTNGYAAAYRQWREGREASLRALRALAHRLNPSAAPAMRTRAELVGLVAAWNDDDKRTPEQVAEALRAAARQAVA